MGARGGGEGGSFVHFGHHPKSLISEHFRCRVWRGAFWLGVEPSGSRASKCPAATRKLILPSFIMAIVSAMTVIIITIMVIMIIVPSIIGSNALLGCSPHRSNLIFPTQHLCMSERPLTPLRDRSKEVLPGEAFEYAGQGRMQ